MKHHEEKNILVAISINLAVKTVMAVTMAASLEPQDWRWVATISAGPDYRGRPDPVMHSAALSSSWPVVEGI